MPDSGLTFFKRHRRKLTITLICIAAIYLLGISLFEKPEIKNTISDFPLSAWLIILACSFFSYLARFARWLIYAKSLHHDLPIVRHFLYYLAGFSLTTTPGKTGETVRALFLLEYKVPVKHTLSMFFSERLLDLAIVILLATSVFTLTEQYHSLVYILSSIVILLVFLIHTHNFTRLINWFAQHAPGQRFPWLFHQLHHLVHSARHLLSTRLVFIGLLIGAVAWSSQAFAFFYITQTGGLDLTLWMAVAAYSVGVLAGAASMIPGGVGSSEVVMALLLKLMGIDLGVAIAVALISRLSTVWFMVFIGLISVFIISLLKPGNNIKEHR